MWETQEKVAAVSAKVSVDVEEAHCLIARILDDVAT